MRDFGALTSQVTCIEGQRSSVSGVLQRSPDISLACSFDGKVTVLDARSAKDSAVAGAGVGGSGSAATLKLAATVGTPPWSVSVSKSIFFLKNKKKVHYTFPPFY